MRKFIVAGNWKMNTTVPQGVELAKAVAEKSKELPANVELVVAPPFTHLVCVADALKGSKVALSAQNCADKGEHSFVSLCIHHTSVYGRGCKAFRRGACVS